MKRRGRTERQRPLLFCCNVIILIVTLLFINAQANPTLDYSCGTDWVNAANTCLKPCPSGRDEECSELGNNHGCYYFTGCKDRFEELKKEAEEQAALEEEVIVEIPAEQNQFCASTFIEAMLKCSKDKTCPIGNECGAGEECFGNTNCDRELKEPTSDMVFTLSGGPADKMEEEDLTIFKSTIFAVLQQSLIDIKIHLETLSVTNQRYFSSEENVEVSVILTAKYRPPPETNLDTIVENSINLQKESVRGALKQAANDAKRWYFATINEISAVSRENATIRPTVRPTGAPNLSPTDVPSSYPTSSPSGSPTSSPSDVPSSSPSRMHIQEVVTATSNELKSSTDASYGVVFNVRTAINVPVVLINGLHFYTESTDFVGYELWSRLGSFKDYKGIYEGWDLIASGVVKGAGYGKFTSIPSNTITEVSIPGRGGERAFYLTLNSMDLIYSASKESGDSDIRVHASSPELEIYEGEAVLNYPFPNEAYMYRSPRLFLGVIQYDRLPCKPLSLYGPVNDLPCAEIRTITPTKRPTPQPTTSPTKASFTEKPTIDPQTAMELPTMSLLITSSLSPSISSAPTTSTSPTLYPTSSPVVPIRAYIVVTLRKTLNRDMSAGENGGFFDIFVPFLRLHCKRAMLVQNIDLWSEEQITVAVPLVSNATYSTAVVATRVVEGWQQVQATRLTLVLKISSTTLPLNLLGSMAAVAIEENEAELLKEIGVLGELYKFFANVDQVAAFSIDSVTEAPVASPAEKDTVLPELVDGITIAEEVPTPAGVVLGVTVAILWTLLATFSISYLIKERSKMNDRINEVMGKIDPLNPDARVRLSNTYSKQTSTDTDISDKSGDISGRRIGVTKKDVARSLDSNFPRQRRNENLSRSLPVLSFTLTNDDLAKSIELDEMEIGLRQNLRSSLSRSGGQRNLYVRDSMRRSDSSQNHLRASMQRSDSQGNLRTSLRDSMRRSDSSQNHLRASMQRSDSQGNLRTSLRDSMRHSDSKNDLRASIQRRDSQGNLRTSLRDSMRRSESQNDLRASMQRSDSQGNLRTSLRDSMRRSGSQNDLRASIQRSDSQGNLRTSLRDSMRRSDSKNDLRASMQRSVSQGNLRTSLRDSMRRSESQNDLRASIQMSDSQGNLRTSLRDSMRRSESQNDLRASMQRSDSQGNLRTSLRDSMRRSESQNDLRASMQRSDSQGNLRTSLRDSMRHSDSKNDLRASIQRSDSQGNLRTSLRDSMRRSESQDNLRASMQRSDSQGNLRTSLRDSMRHSDSKNDLRASIQRSDSQGNLRTSLRDSMRRSESQDNLRASMQRSDSQGNLRTSLRDSMRHSDSKNDLRASIQRSDSQGNLRTSLRDSMRRSESQNDLRASIQRSDSQGNLRTSLRDSMRRSGSQNKLRASIQRSDSQSNLRSPDSHDNLRARSDSQSNLRSSGDRGLRGSSHDEMLRGSGNNLRGSGNKSLRGSGKNELGVSFVGSNDMSDHDINISKRRIGRSADLSKSMTAPISVDSAREGGGEQSRRRSDSNISIPQSKADNGNISKSSRSTEKGTCENDGLKSSGTNPLESLTRTQPRRSGTEGKDALRRSGSKRSSEDLNKTRHSAVTRTSDNILRSSGGRGRSSLSQSMSALRSDDALKSNLRMTVDNERPDSLSNRSATEQRSRNSLRSSARGDQPAMSQSTTRRLVDDNERSARRLRNSTGDLRSSTKGDGLKRSHNEQPDSHRRNSSIEQRNHDNLNLRSSGRGDRMNFGNLVRKVSETRYTRRSSRDTDKNDIEALKRNLIL